VILASGCIAGPAAWRSALSPDCKRPFSLLRLSGVPLDMLRRIVALETAVPLLITAVVATSAGALAAQLFLKSQMDYNIRPPGAEYYIAVVAGIAASLGAIASTLPLLKHIIGPQTVRNE
jgi:FtsX-like permease family protein